MIPLAYEENEFHKKHVVCYICIKEFNTDDGNTKYHEVRHHCHYAGKYRGAAHSTCNLRRKTPKEISAVFHNSSTYDYHFIIKDLVEKFEEQFECLGGNTEKYITFSVTIKKELDNGKTTTYKTKFYNSFRCISS